MRGEATPSRIHRTAWLNSIQLRKSNRENRPPFLAWAVYFFVLFVFKVTTIEISVTIIEITVVPIPIISIIGIALLFR